jgi:IS1 family transposase
VHQARFYYSDLFATCRILLYQPRLYTPIPDKSETFRVEDDNAELRHDIARLARKSCCFSRCLQVRVRASKLFVYLWNLRQLAHQRFPAYPLPAH